MSRPMVKLYIHTLHVMFEKASHVNRFSEKNLYYLTLLIILTIHSDTKPLVILGF